MCRGYYANTENVLCVMVVCGLHGYTIVCVSGQRVMDRIQSR